jgi:hypothetical protein
VTGELCFGGLRRDSTFEEVDEMRATGLWNTYRRVRLEKSLLTVPREERRALRGYVSGKRVR